MLSSAHKQGWIGTEVVVRGAMVIIGLGLAAIGNLIPKSRGGPPPQTLELAALRQRVFRIAGLALMLGGLAFAELSVFAPLDLAPKGALITVGGSIAVMIAYVVEWIVACHRAPIR